MAAIPLNRTASCPAIAVGVALRSGRLTSAGGYGSAAAASLTFGRNSGEVRPVGAAPVLGDTGAANLLLALNTAIRRWFPPLRRDYPFGHRADVLPIPRSSSSSLRHMRAAGAVNHLLPGRNRDKLLARMFGCSVRTAQYLRAGQFWTVERLSQASRVLGVAFDRALYTPVSSAQHALEMDDIAERLARLEDRVAQMDRGSDAGLASETGAPADDAGDTGRLGRAMVVERLRVVPDPRGPSAPGGLPEVGGTLHPRRRGVAK